MPDLSGGILNRSLTVTRRNGLAWRKSAGPALLGSFAEPLFYLFALGYGLGHFIGPLQGASYIAFLSSGILATSAMNTATFEGLYLAYTRMEVLRTWEGMLAAPLDIADIVIGEVLWMGTKSLISASSILLVTALLGLVESWLSLWVLPIAFMTGLCFGSMALVVTSYSKSYDFFVYYITLFMTPMILLSGVFFPVQGLPSFIQVGVGFLPLLHVVELIRPLLSGHLAQGFSLHLSVLALFFMMATLLAIARFKKRLLQ